jgi:coproporphyrinogen III oxidase-like Fe-S oxidoreductase
MEVDPRFCDAAMVEAMAALVVTRAGLGVQDFDAAVQEAINRPQTFDVTAATLQRQRDVGISAFNIDLVYGLPRQTVDTLSRTLDQALALTPDRFAVIGYAHVPWMKPHQKLIAAESGVSPSAPTTGCAATSSCSLCAAAKSISANLPQAPGRTGRLPRFGRRSRAARARWLISTDGWRIAVTDRGRPLVRYVCAAFDRYYTGDEDKHSSGL